MFRYHDYFRRELSIALSHSIEQQLGVKFAWEKIYSNLGPTPSKEAGDLAFPLFNLAKEAKLNPAQAAKALALAPNALPKFIHKKVALGPYLNFFYDFQVIAHELLPQILEGNHFKQTLTENTPKTMIEYSQPNTHKELHVGHMRNLCYGDALIKILRYAGFHIVASTFPGDVGTHVAKCLWFMKYHNQEPIPEERKGAWLGSLYSKAHNKLEEERGTEKEASNREQLTIILKELEQKSGEFFELWKETRQWSIQLMQEVYSWAGVKFDVWYWESEVDSDSVKLAKDYLKQGIFKEDQGCVGVDLSAYNLGFCMLLKTDGNGLYATKDIELARRKFQEHQIEKSLYVVDKRQEHHFKQVFKTLEVMGFEHAKNCQHLQYDFVELPDGAMSSRKGNIIPLQDLIEKMKETIKDQYLNRYLGDWSPTEIEETAQIVAKGAIKYGMNKIDPAKKIVFDMQEWLKLDGESGPYIQYACARIQSMLKKITASPANSFVIDTPQEKELLSLLMGFNLAVQEAAIHYKPSFITCYLYDLARAYNGFYAECPVGSSEGDVKSTRLALSQATVQTLAQGLKLLGIEAPSRM